MDMDLMNRNGPAPLHQQVLSRIYAEIVAGTYGVGERLPTEREYAERFAVSLAPVRAALAQLVQSGHLERRQGKGTFLVDDKVQYNVQLLSSCTHSLREAGASFTVRVITHQKAEPPPPVAAALRLRSGQAAFHLERVISIRDKPAILLESWVPATFAKAVDDITYFENGGSLYARLREAGATLLRSHGLLEVARSDGRLIELLQLPFGAPMLAIGAIVTDAGGRPYEWSRGLYDPSRISLLLERSLDEVTQ